MTSSRPAIIVKTYKGSSQADAMAQFQHHAGLLAADGYVPITQLWAPDSRRGVDFLVAVLLCFLLVGILIFFYLLIVKPKSGTLTVTYQLQARP